ncbi:hypothetical protein [Azospirillum palustre]
MPRPVRVCCGHRHIPTAGPARGRYCTHARPCCQRFGSWSEAGLRDWFAGGGDLREAMRNQSSTHRMSQRPGRGEDPAPTLRIAAGKSQPPIPVLGLANGDRPRPQRFRRTRMGVSRPAKETLSPGNGLLAGTRVARL